MFAIFVTYTTDIRYRQWRWYNSAIGCFQLSLKHASDDRAYGCLPTNHYRYNKYELESNHLYVQYLDSQSLHSSES